MTKDFDLAAIMANGGHCVTRDGTKARIICMDAACTVGRVTQPIVALLNSDDPPYTYCADGRYLPGEESGADLLTYAPKRMVKVDRWLSVWNERDIALESSRPNAGPSEKARIHIIGDIEVGAEVTLRIP